MPKLTQQLLTELAIRNVKLFRQALQSLRYQSTRFGFRVITSVTKNWFSMKRNCSYLLDHTDAGCLPTAERVGVKRPVNKDFSELYNGLIHNRTTAQTTVLNWGC